MMPQKPETLLQKIICDADMFHFTKPSYLKNAEALRQELDTFLGVNYSDKGWHEYNLRFIQSHNYFTKYGKEVLTEFKKINEERVLRILAAS